MPRPVNIGYRVFPTPQATAFAGAQLFTDAVAKAATARGVARVAISGGTTPKTMFALLADPAQPFLKQVPWDKIELYWVDERCVPPDNAESNYRMTKEALLSKVPADATGFITGSAPPANSQTNTPATRTPPAATASGQRRSTGQNTQIASAAGAKRRAWSPHGSKPRSQNAQMIVPISSAA